MTSREELGQFLGIELKHRKRSGDVQRYEEKRHEEKRHEEMKALLNDNKLNSGFHVNQKSVVGKEHRKFYTSNRRDHPMELIKEHLSDYNSKMGPDDLNRLRLLHRCIWRPSRKEDSDEYQKNIIILRLSSVQIRDDLKIMKKLDNVTEKVTDSNSTSNEDRKLEYSKCKEYFARW